MGVNSVQVHAALEGAFRNETLISPDMFRQATRNWGDPSRLRQFFRKLLRGECPLLRACPVKCCTWHKRLVPVYLTCAFPAGEARCILRGMLPTPH